MSVLGEETLNTSVYAHVDLHRCHVMTDHFLQAIALVGQPPATRSTSAGTVARDGAVDMACSVASSRTSKLLRIAAFGPALPSPFDYSFRIYVVMDTDDALQACSDE